MVHFSNKTVCLPFDRGFAYASSIPFSDRIPSDSRAAYKSDVPCSDNIAVQHTKQPTCSQLAPIDGSPSQSDVDDAHRSQLHCDAVLISYNDLTLAYTSKPVFLSVGHVSWGLIEESYSSESSSGRSQIYTLVY
eukprot:SAG31_NODE_5905_length_2264_cov_1.627252_2_plen_134_part_00